MMLSGFQFPTNLDNMFLIFRFIPILKAIVIFWMLNTESK